MSERGPVLIGGLAHTGKTQLRQVLDAVPDLSLTRRTYLWRDVYLRHGDLAADENLDRCLDAMSKIEGVRVLEPDLGELRSQFRAGEATYPRLIRLFHEQVAARRGRGRWGDQMGLLELWAGVILASYPDARMIHMIRDPVQLHSVRLKRTKSRPGRLGWNTARWKSSVAAALANASRFPDRYLVVRYEDLVVSPANTFQTVCSFLGEDLPAETESILAEIRFDQVDVGAGDETSFTRRFVGQYAGGLMQHHGYGPSPAEVSPMAWARYGATVWPINRASMTAWRLIQPGGIRT